MKVPVLGAQIELIVLYLALPMLFFTLWLGFPNLTAVGRALRILRAQPHAGEAKGDVSQWGALSTALSGTTGQLGRAPWRGRVWPYGLLSVGGVSLKKKPQY